MQLFSVTKTPGKHFTQLQTKLFAKRSSIIQALFYSWELITYVRTFMGNYCLGNHGGMLLLLQIRDSSVVARCDTVLFTTLYQQRRRRRNNIRRLGRYLRLSRLRSRVMGVVGDRRRRRRWCIS